MLGLFSFVGSYCLSAHSGILGSCQQLCWFVTIIFLILHLYHLFIGLGYYSEQAFESMHSDIKVREENM